MASDVKKAAKLAAQGVAFHQAGQIDIAEGYYRRALALDARNIDALHLLGVVQRSRGELAEALRLIAESLRHNPRQHGALNNLAEIEIELEEFDSAASHLRQALSFAPDLQPAWVNLAVALLRARRYDEADAVFSQAVARYPGHIDLRAYLAEFLLATGRADEARAQLEAIRPHPPRKLAGLHQRARIFSGLKLHADAAQCLRAVYGHDPAALWALAVARYELDMACDWSERTSMLAELSSRLAAAPPSGQAGERKDAVVPPFGLLSLADDPALHLDLARRFAAALPVPRPVARGEGKTGERIRLGYLSADFHAHATAFLLVGVLEQHDRSRFEVFAYSTGPDDGSPTRARVVAACEHFVELAGAGSAAIAERIAADGIDILVDLKGYTQDSRNAVLLARPAPVQVNFLGYPGSLGMAAVDYIIADPVLIPDELRPYYSERVVRLPVCYQPNDDKRMSEEIPEREAEGLPREGVVLCCFNRSYKYSPEMFDIWCRVLQSCPGSVLWLLVPDAAVAANLAREAERRGVDPGRLVFAEPAPPARHWARLALADVFVDTFPYGAHTTASDALWMGVPVLTRVGRSFASRVAASLLSAVGLPELAAASAADYEAMLRRLATDGAWRLGLRRRLAEQAGASPLFDTARYTRELEQAFGEMCRRRRQGLPPADFDLPPAA